MIVFTLRKFVELFKRYGLSILITSWTLGLLAGFIAACSNLELLSASILNICNQDASFISLILSGLVPLMLSYIAFKLSAVYLIIPIALMKGFTYSFCSVCLISVFGSAGWLLRSMLLFSTSFWSLIHLYFWIKIIANPVIEGTGLLLRCIGIAVFFVLIDYLYIVPLLTSLF